MYHKRVHKWLRSLTLRVNSNPWLTCTKTNVNPHDEKHYMACKRSSSPTYTKSLPIFFWQTACKTKPKTRFEFQLQQTACDLGHLNICMAVAHGNPHDENHFMGRHPFFPMKLMTKLMALTDGLYECFLPTLYATRPSAWVFYLFLLLKKRNALCWVEFTW